MQKAEETSGERLPDAECREVRPGLRMIKCREVRNSRGERDDRENDRYLIYYDFDRSPVAEEAAGNEAQ